MFVTSTILTMHQLQAVPQVEGHPTCLSLKDIKRTLVFPLNTGRHLRALRRRIAAITDPILFPDPVLVLANIGLGVRLGDPVVLGGLLGLILEEVEFEPQTDKGQGRSPRNQDEHPADVVETDPLALVLQLGTLYFVLVPPFLL